MRLQMSFLLVLAVTLTVALGTVSAQQPDSGVPYTKDSLAKVLQQIEAEKAILLDVRSPAEWKRAHLKAAQLIPTGQLRDPEKRSLAVEDLDKDQVIYVHCQVGGRAKICGDILHEMGYTVKPLKVRYEELVSAGFEEVRGK